MPEEIKLLPAGKREERKVSPWLVGGIAVGAAGAAALAIYALAKAPPPSPPEGGKFGYHNLMCSAPWDEEGLDYIYDIECDVVNEGSVRETRTVQFWDYWYYTHEWFKAAQVQVTLDPGESYHYHLRGGHIPYTEPSYEHVGFVTDNYLQWEWCDGERCRPDIGDMSPYCSFYGG